MRPKKKAAKSDSPTSQNATAGPSRGRHWAAVRDAASMAGDFPTAHRITVSDGQAARSCTFLTAVRCGLRIVCLPGHLFDLLRQSLVARGDFAHLPPGVRVLHGLGSEQDFFGACSPGAGKQ